MRLLVISLAAGAAVFLVLRVLMDASIFGIAPQAEFLRPPAGGLSPAAALDYANWSTASYWIALVVALIVLTVTPLVRWSATWPGPEAGPPLAPGANAAGRGAGRRPPELWPDGESEKRWRAMPAAPAAVSIRPVPPAKAPAAASAARGAAAWTPPSNDYAQTVKSRYDAARLRPSRKLAEERPARSGGAVKPAKASRR